MVTKLNIIGLLAILSIGLNNIDARLNKHLQSDETTTIGEDATELGWREQATQFGKRHRWKISTALAGAVAFLEARTIKRQAAQIAELRAQLAPFLPQIEPVVETPAQPARPATPPRSAWQPSRRSPQSPKPAQQQMEPIDEEDAQATQVAMHTPTPAYIQEQHCPTCSCTR